jgi:hypothetical protein
MSSLIENQNTGPVKLRHAAYIIFCFWSTDLSTVSVLPGVDGRIKVRKICRKWVGGCMDWTDLTQDRDRCQALENEVIRLRVHEMQEIS